MIGLEGVTVARWVHQRLTTDATLQTLAGSPAALTARVSEGPAADGHPWWITFTILEPIDVKTADARHIMSMVEFQVMVGTTGASYTPIVPVYSRVHTLLESQTNQEVTDGIVLTAHRVSGIQFPERTNGIDYRHLGGRFRTHSQ